MFLRSVNIVVDWYEIEGHKVHESEVNPTGNSAHVIVPKRWRSVTVKVVRVTDPSDESGE
ncbi:DUF2080 family transposase-associated protein [Halalkalicoccus tibetensis]|uniref:DUF2080 family transposase-associated protein n=1 Tax=Halalkalicoccus tibetensis TaxID=175632 RepID=A0ABD5V465_9EURY